MAGREKSLFAALGAALVALAVVATSPAATAPVKLKGTQTVVNQAKGLFEMHGSLVGKWNTTAFVERYAGADGEFVGTGKEIFIGCQDADLDGACTAGEPAGTLRFSFVYWANYNPKTQALVKGQCVHPVIGGTGDFAKARGVIHMKDRPAKTGIVTTYTGTVSYARVTAGRAPAGLRAMAAVGTCGG